MSNNYFKVFTWLLVVITNLSSLPALSAAFSDGSDTEDTEADETHEDGDQETVNKPFIDELMQIRYFAKAMSEIRAILGVTGEDNEEPIFKGKSEISKSKKNKIVARKKTNYDPIIKQWIKYYSWVAGQLDYFDNGILNDDLTSKGKVDFKDAKECRKIIQNALFSSKKFEELTKTQLIFVYKYEFYVFYRLVTSGVFLETLGSQKPSKKLSNALITIFKKLAEKIDFDIEDMTYIHLAHIYRHFDLSKVDSEREFTQILLGYSSIRIFNNRKWKAAQEASNGECKVCFDDMVCLKHREFCSEANEKSISDVLYCPGCLAKFIDTEVHTIKGGAFSVCQQKCPVQNCHAQLSTKDWKFYMENGILSRNLVVRILENRVRTLATPEINALIPCSNGDCYNLLRLGDQPIIECNHCGEITCKLCHNPYRGSCCNSFIVPDGLEIKPCPLCNSLCEREGGCAFITCPSCKGKFDIQTGKLWTKEYAKEERGGMHSSGAMSEDAIRKTKKRIKKMQKLNSLSEDSTQSGDDKEDPEL